MSETLKKTLDLIARLLGRPPEDGLLSEQLLEFQAMKSQALQFKPLLGVPRGGMITGPSTGPAGDSTVAVTLGVMLVLDLIGLLRRGRQRP